VKSGYFTNLTVGAPAGGTKNRQKGEFMEDIGQLLKSMNDDQLRLLAREANQELRERNRKVDLTEITAERMRDPEFAKQVRSEVESALSDL
jgi:hypothetical protein